MVSLFWGSGHGAQFRQDLTKLALIGVYFQCLLNHFNCFANLVMSDIQLRQQFVDGKCLRIDPNRVVVSKEVVLHRLQRL